MHLIQKKSSLGVLLLLIGCASSPSIKSLAYAKLSHQKTFEYSFPIVWKGIENALRKYKINNRNPDDISPIDLKKLARRTLETDWIYGESRDKYEEFSINGIPKKIPLQGRYKISLEAKRNLAGILVSIQVAEEIESINADGSPNGYRSEKSSDPSRAAELLNTINNAILSLPNTE